MKMVRRSILVVFLAFAGLMSQDIQAQCPMCKMSAETNLRNGGTAGRGFNAGILYMLALPYSLVATFGFILWRNNRRSEEDEVEVLP
jgi:hypothetical protein